MFTARITYLKAECYGTVRTFMYSFSRELPNIAGTLIHKAFYAYVGYSPGAKYSFLKICWTNL